MSAASVHAQAGRRRIPRMGAMPASHSAASQPCSGSGKPPSRSRSQPVFIGLAVAVCGRGGAQRLLERCALDHGVDRGRVVAGLGQRSTAVLASIGAGAADRGGVAAWPAQRRRRRSRPFGARRRADRPRRRAWRPGCRRAARSGKPIGGGALAHDVGDASVDLTSMCAARAPWLQKRGSSARPGWPIRDSRSSVAWDGVRRQQPAYPVAQRRLEGRAAQMVARTRWAMPRTMGDLRTCWPLPLARACQQADTRANARVAATVRSASVSGGIARHIRRFAGPPAPRCRFAPGSGRHRPDVRHKDRFRRSRRRPDRRCADCAPPRCHNPAPAAPWPGGGCCRAGVASLRQPSRLAPSGVFRSSAIERLLRFRCRLARRWRVSGLETTWLIAAFRRATTSTASRRGRNSRSRNSGRSPARPIRPWTASRARLALRWRVETASAAQLARLHEGQAEARSREHEIHLAADHVGQACGVPCTGRQDIDAARRASVAPATMRLLLPLA
ncbi:hypothetical protein FQR65_LT18341 [Abscondita terminalis]|nr:hypothetical protein FQR65_LT18341 [Abscondita terminalis]